jgi:hypothetical protein
MNEPSIHARLEALRHLGGLPDLGLPDLGIQDWVYERRGYCKIVLDITAEGVYKHVDLWWKRGKISGLETAIENAKHRDYWKKLSDSADVVYFKKTFERGDKPLGNISDLQKFMEDNPDSLRNLTLWIYK